MICWKELLFGLIALLNTIPIIILLVKHTKAKGRNVFKNSRFYILGSILCLDIVILAINLFKIGNLSLHFLLIQYIFKGIATFSIIYFVFDKASK